MNHSSYYVSKTIFIKIQSKFYVLTPIGSFSMLNNKFKNVIGNYARLKYITN